MTPNCDRHHERIAAECVADRPWSSSLEEHLRECESCSAHASAMVRNLGALRGLPSLPAPTELAAAVSAALTEQGRSERLASHLSGLAPQTAPAELEGRVVSACQAGFREDRAVEGLLSVTPHRAPKALDHRIEGLFEELRGKGELGAPVAPVELEERVDSDLQDLPRSVSRTLLGKLGRLAVPGELAERVDRDLGESEILAFPMQASWRMKSIGAGLGVAAALVLWMGLTEDWMGLNGGTTQNPNNESTAGFTFAVERTAKLEALTPRSLQLGSSLIPGLNAHIEGFDRRVPIEFEGTEGNDDALAAPQGLGAPSSSSPSGSQPTNGRHANRRPAGPGPASSSGPGVTGGSATQPGFGSGAAGSTAATHRFGPAYLNRCASALEQISIKATRRVMTRTRQDDMVTEFEYREEIVTDGQGGFTILPTQVLSAHPEYLQESEFLASQAAREGFFFRHRGFLIRDLDEFWRNYDVTDLGTMSLVANRFCEEFDIIPRSGNGNRFRIAIDPATSILLREERFDSAGLMIERIVYESYEVNPDLSSYQLTGGPTQFLAFDVNQPPSLFQDEILQPIVTPAGYKLQSTGYRANAGMNGLPWAQFIYGNGVEEIFFLCEDVPPAMGNGGSAGVPLGSNGQGDSVRSYSFGNWTMIEGRVAGRFVLVIGQADEQDLLLMLQSAVE